MMVDSTNTIGLVILMQEFVESRRVNVNEVRAWLHLIYECVLHMDSKALRKEKGHAPWLRDWTIL